jgi:integrase/recombinase XerC
MVPGDSFLEVLEARLDDDDLASSTIERTLIDCRQFSTWFEETNGNEIDPEDVQIVSVDLREYRGWLQRAGMTPGTITRKFASIRKSLMLIDPRLALDLDWPKLPQQQQTSPSGFSRNERHSILRAAEQLSTRDEAIVKLLLYTGPRASSLAQAKLSNVTINERSGEITYDVTKTNREYSVPLNAEVRKALSAWIDERPPVDHGFLFTAERFPHRPISRHVVYHVWHERMRQLLPKPLADKIRGPHQGRHDLARRLLSGSEGRHTPVPAADAAAILGHADSRVVVSTYSRPSEEDKRRALDRLVGDEE